MRNHKRGECVKTEIVDFNGAKILNVTSEEIVINKVQDALDLMADGYYSNVQRIIVKEENLAPEFFDLSTRIAGEILQKFSNYNVMLAVVGDFKKYKSENLKDFIFESNKAGRIIFVPTVEEAKAKLTM